MGKFVGKVSAAASERHARERAEREAAAPNDAAAGIAPTLTRRSPNRQGELVFSMPRLTSSDTSAIIQRTLPLRLLLIVREDPRWMKMPLLENKADKEQERTLRAGISSSLTDLAPGPRQPWPWRPLHLLARGPVYLGSM